MALTRVVNGQVQAIDPDEEAAIIAEWAENDPANRIAPDAASVLRSRIDGDPLWSALVDHMAAKDGVSRDQMLIDIAGTPGLAEALR